MSIYELKICFDLNPESKSKTLDKYAKEFDLGYFFVDSDDGQCYLFNRHGKEKDISLIHEIDEDMIPIDIKQIVIPDGIMRIGSCAFEGCSELISVTIPDNITKIGKWMFYDCNRLKSVTIPNSVTSVEDNAFSYCSSLTSVTIPDSVTSIGDNVFFSCRGLMNVIIGNGVMNIGYRVFHDCNNLKSIVFKGKTMKQIKAMANYPFGIKDESIIEAELS